MDRAVGSQDGVPAETEITALIPLMNSGNAVDDSAVADLPNRLTCGDTEIRAESREPRAESREPRAESREPRAETTARLAA